MRIDDHAIKEEIEKEEEDYMTYHASLQQRRSWRKYLKGTVTLTSGLAVLWGIHTPAEAASQCTVGGSKPTHPTIQAAVSDTACAKVKVAAGTWAPFTITRSVEVRGAKGAIIQPAVTGVPDTVPSHAIIAITGATTSATIRSLTVQGPVNAGVAELVGIFVGNGATATITKNSILDIRESATGGFGAGEKFHAIRIGASDAATSTGIATISNNIISGYQKSGILVQNAGSNATVTKNTITGTARTSATVPSPFGIEVDRKSLATISKNKISGNDNSAATASSAGILLAGSGDNVIVSGNAVTGNDVAICLKRTNKATIDKNKVDNNSDGIVLDNQIDSSDQLPATTTTNNNTVTRNKVLDSNGIGIGILSSNGNTVERNTLDNNDADGILVSCNDLGAGCTQAFSKDNTFTRNNSIFNALKGIHDESGASSSTVKNTYTGNKCKNNDGGASTPDGLCQ